MEERARRVLDRLDEMGLSYEYIEHEAASHMDECRAIEAQLGAMVPRNLFLTTRRQGGYYLLVLRPDAPFQSGLVSRQIGSSRLCFADEEVLEGCLSLRPGAVSPLGLLFDRERRVTLLWDRALDAQERLVFHPCVNTASVVLKTRDFLDVFLPAVDREPIRVDLDA